MELGFMNPKIYLVNPYDGSSTLGKHIATSHCIQLWNYFYMPVVLRAERQNKIFTVELIWQKWFIKYLS